MTLKLYNTRTRQLDDFQPKHVQSVGLYACGPTVYSTAHIGNLRTYVFEDILRRTLEYNGLTVKHVMNITDVGHLTGDGDFGVDKIEAQAKATKQSAYDIAAHHTTEFFSDLERLHIEHPSVILKATDTIPLQIELIQKLEAKGHTYQTSDGVYFDTSTDAQYGRLSGQRADEKLAGARVEVNGEKKHPSDFALWKFSQPSDQRQMEWPSPWGTGFPGWHIECSAMSISEFPDGLDIHCGGIDHVPVHHENEIAQNEGAGYHDFVNVWMHGEFLVLPGKRMGKSEGNSITLQNIIDQHIDPLAYRYLCLLTHYRKPLSFTAESLRAAATALRSIWVKLAPEPMTTGVTPHPGYLTQFTDAINDDLNTPQAIGLLHNLLADKNVSREQKVATLAQFDRVLGIDLTPDMAKSHVPAVKEYVAANDELTELLQQRTVARAAKDFTLADELREKIEAAGFIIVDGPNGPHLRQK